jgi:hypothetical protein
MSTEKEKALAHLRSVCPELMELSFGCEVVLLREEYSKNKAKVFVTHKREIKDRDTIVELCEAYSNGTSNLFYEDKSNLKIIGHTPHPHHWLKGLWESSGTWMLKPVHEGFEFVDMHNFGKKSFKNHYIRYGDTDEFYQAYNQITGI